MEEIDAYYHCYNQRKSLNFVLENFRKVYPTSQIKLISDGGLDYSAEAQRYKCDYEYKQNIKSAYQAALYSERENLYLWISRFLESVKKFNNKYFMLLEDDVYIMKKTDISSLKYDINGYNPYSKFPNEIINNISLYNLDYIKNNNFSWGGCGGSIYKTKFFDEIFINHEILKEDINEYCNLCNYKFWAGDTALSYLCVKYGGTIGNYQGFCETWHEDYQERLNKKDIEVLHKFKEFYE